MDILFLIGRVLFGGYFVMSGFNHFKNHAGLTGYAASKGVPSPSLAVHVTGILLLIGGLGVLLGVYIEWAALALAVFFIPVTFIMHAYWKDTDPGMKMANQINFWKNLALLGAALLLLSIPQPWPYSL
jgi:uncharacterized membrane protein YphA (DoxX/SURF4 family)